MESAIVPARLPDSYDENLLVLMVQNPHVVFCYFELGKTFRALLARNGGRLRLNEVGEGDESRMPVEDVALSPEAANWYFRGVADGRSYDAELGWRAADGLFLSLLRSNVVHTPASSPPAGGAGGEDPPTSFGG